jgi:hypothetical protein
LTISRAPTRSASAWNPMPTRTLRPQPSAPARGEDLYPRAVQPAADCQPCAPAVRVA